MIVTSASNERIKSIRRLYKDKKERDKSGLYIAEGVTMYKDLLKSDVESVYLAESKTEELLPLVEGVPYYIVKDSVFDSLADTRTPSGIIAVVKKRQQSDEIGEMTAVLCGVSDCGNVGTIMRTACARGIKTLFFVDAADPYAPKSVRASMGAVQKLNLVSTDYETVFSVLSDYEKLVLDASGEDVYSYEKKGKIAFFVGNEAHGVPTEAKKKCDHVLSIPMIESGVESLNAAVAASIAMYIVR